MSVDTLLDAKNGLIATDEKKCCTVRLLDVMPSKRPKDRTADYAIVEAARTSYHTDAAIKERVAKQSNDRGLIRMLLRHQHTSPFEMVELKFHIQVPFFVKNQLIRHRTANVNEYSARYASIPTKFYRPELRMQSKNNKQCSSNESPTELLDEMFQVQLDEVEHIFKGYLELVEHGAAREIARTVTTQNTYTTLVWKIDLHNLLHFLKLRLHHTAQLEIQWLAQSMLKLVEPIFPLTFEAWRDFELESVRFSRLELDALSKILSTATVTDTTIANTATKREKDEWIAKIASLSKIQ